jgi:hypothetical protein
MTAATLWQARLSDDAALLIGLNVEYLQFVSDGISERNRSAGSVPPRR